MFSGKKYKYDLVKISNFYKSLKNILYYLIQCTYCKQSYPPIVNISNIFTFFLKKPSLLYK